MERRGSRRRRRRRRRRDRDIKKKNEGDGIEVLRKAGRRKGKGGPEVMIIYFSVTQLRHIPLSPSPLP